MEEKTNENISRWDQFNLIIDNQELDIKEKGLLLILFRFVNYKTGYADPSRDLLKKLYGTKRNETLDNVLKSLINKKYILRESGKGCKNRTKYKLLIGTENGSIPKNVSITKNGGSIGTENGTTIGTENGTQKENIKEKEKKIIYKDLKFIDDVIDKVKITEEQYQKLIDKYSLDLVNKQILALDNYIANGKGKKYKEHYRVLNLWCQKDNESNRGNLTKNLIEEEEKYITG